MLLAPADFRKCFGAEVPSVAVRESMLDTLAGAAEKRSEEEQAVCLQPLSIGEKVDPWEGIAAELPQGHFEHIVLGWKREHFEGTAADCSKGVHQPAHTAADEEAGRSEQVLRSLAGRKVQGPALDVGN
jgi:hypothetical protein